GKGAALVLGASIVAALPACRHAEDNVRGDDPTGGAAHLYEGFENYTRPVATDSELAQRYVDQGMQWLYGFNDDEAIRAFREAARHDPDLALPWWGIAYAAGININDPVMSEAEWRIAWEAIREAQARLDKASEVEKRLILALAKRDTWPPVEEIKPLEEAYADAMEEVWRAHPEDPDVGVLYAEARMNLQPWDYWTIDGAPKGRAEEI